MNLIDTQQRKIFLDILNEKLKHDNICINDLSPEDQNKLIRMLSYYTNIGIVPSKLSVNNTSKLLAKFHSSEKIHRKMDLCNVNRCLEYNSINIIIIQ